MEINWEDKAKNDFDKVIENLPQFHRTIAKVLVKAKAEQLAKNRNSETVQNEDLIKAFFAEVPPAFKEMMKRLLNQYNINYTEYIDE